MLSHLYSFITTPTARAFTFDYEVNGRRIDGILMQPTSEGTFPVIIWNRGGTGEFGKINRDSAYLDLLPLAEAGYVVVASQYRIDDQHMGDDLYDIQALYPILQKLEHVDPRRIGMVGFSRGGSAVYQLLRMVDWIRAAVIISGATDYISLMQERPDMHDLFQRMGIHSIEELTKRSAMTFVETLPKKTPLLLIHGTRDDRVPFHHSADMKAELDKHHIQNSLLMLKEKSHNFREFRQEAHSAILAFFGPILQPSQRTNRCALEHLNLVHHMSCDHAVRTKDI